MLLTLAMILELKQEYKISLEIINKRNVLIYTTIGQDYWLNLDHLITSFTFSFGRKLETRKS